MWLFGLISRHETHFGELQKSGRPFAHYPKPYLVRRHLLLLLAVSHTAAYITAAAWNHLIM